MNTDKYKLPETPHPERPVTPILTTALAPNPSKAMVVQYQEALSRHAIQVEAYRRVKLVWDDYWTDRQHQSNRLLEDFWRDAREELGYGQHPKKGRLEAWAHEYGHAGGIPTIWDELVRGWDLLKEDNS